MLGSELMLVRIIFSYRTPMRLSSCSRVVWSEYWCTQLVRNCSIADGTDITLPDSINIFTCKHKVYFSYYYTRHRQVQIIHDLIPGGQKVAQLSFSHNFQSDARKSGNFKKRNFYIFSTGIQIFNSIRHKIQKWQILQKWCLKIQHGAAINGK